MSRRGLFSRGNIILLLLAMVLAGFLMHRVPRYPPHTQVKEIFRSRRLGHGHPSQTVSDHDLRFSITDILRSSEDQIRTKKGSADQEKPTQDRYFDIEDIIKSKESLDTYLKAPNKSTAGNSADKKVSEGTKGGDLVQKGGEKTDTNVKVEHKQNLVLPKENAKQPQVKESKKQTDDKKSVKTKDSGQAHETNQQKASPDVLPFDKAEQINDQNSKIKDAPNTKVADEKRPKDKENQQQGQLTQSVKEHGRSREKFLIYLCDNKTYCYGLGDRQRGIASTYYLAELTGRRFGMIMTSPSNIREFYEPNLVDWDIPQSELPKNATKLEIEAYGSKVDLHLETIDFNSVYPQDIIYMRTNQVFWHSTLKNPLYRDKVPDWGRTHRSALIGIGLLRLMKPTSVLRDSLNTALVDVAQKLSEEAEVATKLNKDQCCKKISLPKDLPSCSEDKTICSKNKTAQECCNTLAKKMFAGCSELRIPCSGIDSTTCEKSLSSAFPKRWDPMPTQKLAHNYCTLPPSVSKLNDTIESLYKKQGYDLTDLNLVCAHIRLGKSKTMPFESVVFNEQEGVTGVWDFLKGYAKKGYHMYLASDAQEVKDEARAIFGDRLHMAEKQIVHIANAQKDHEIARAGFLFTLTEQLFLTTACREIVISHSGYSGRAVEIRGRLMGKRASRIYRYENGIVT